MKLGIINEDIWDFFHEVYTDLDAHYQTSVFSYTPTSLPMFNVRINRFRRRHKMQQFMQVNDVLFSEWASDAFVEFTHLPKAAGFVIRLHRYDIYRWIDDVNWDAVDRIILVSEAKRREFSERLPAQAQKIVVVPEAVSLEKFPYHPRPFRGNLGILCHLTPRKRVYDLILDFYELLQHDKAPDLRLFIGGDRHPLYDDYYGALHRAVHKLGLEHKVIFDDYIDSPQEWFQKIDIFISNSYSEGLQVSPIEAMASGCYCLSHDWAGADELLPQDQLFLTGSDMIEKIIDYCQRPEPEKRQRNARLRAMVEEKFDVSKTAAQIRNVIDDVAQLRSSQLQ